MVRHKVRHSERQGAAATRAHAAELKAVVPAWRGESMLSRDAPHSLMRFIAAQSGGATLARLVCEDA
ncbi:hypothetical protein D4Q52_05955 [Rhodopseudomonas palustris]|uniref:Uncharacterized protein n=1 Tax=Rhodopseudomonas palustris TaxID=1076 RepID=A0A418VKL5_RHOPL|nr:hypothetical protein D4Q52_05955 [Rhodopseudomonas palustris]